MEETAIRCQFSPSSLVTEPHILDGRYAAQMEDYLPTSLAARMVM